MEASLWSESGKHDTDVTLQDGPFRRLQDEGADVLNNSQQHPPPPLAIRVTTDIETSQKMSHLENNNSAIAARQPQW